MSSLLGLIKNHHYQIII